MKKRRTLLFQSAAQLTAEGAQAVQDIRANVVIPFVQHFKAFVKFDLYNTKHGCGQTWGEQNEYVEKLAQKVMGTLLSATPAEQGVCIGPHIAWCVLDSDWCTHVVQSRVQSRVQARLWWHNGSRASDHQLLMLLV